MRKHYSRLSRVEEKRNMKRAFIFSILTIASLAAFVFFGLPAVAKLAGFLIDIRKETAPIETNDTTPPAPPKIQEPPEYTNKKSIDIEGTAEPGVTVTLFINNNKEEVVANNEGRFTFTLKLKDGVNTISAKAKDAAGNESQETQTFTIVYDDDKPKLEITYPSDGDEFFGAKQRQITIQGVTEEGASITINKNKDGEGEERIVTVDTAGNFAFTTTLTEGENSFLIKATDKAGNVTEKSLTVSFTP